MKISFQRNGLVIIDGIRHGKIEHCEEQWKVHFFPESKIKFEGTFQLLKEAKFAIIKLLKTPNTVVRKNYRNKVIVA